MSESQLQSKILKYLREDHSIFVVKLSDKWYSGIPDIMVIKNSYPYFFEVKVKAGRLSKIQEFTIDKMMTAGALFFVIHSLQEVKDIIEGGSLSGRQRD